MIEKIEAFLARYPKVLSLVRVAVYAGVASVLVEAGVAEEIIAAIEAAAAPV